MSLCFSEGPIVPFQISRVRPSLSMEKYLPPLWADATRQKYCDWSGIERDVTWVL